MEARRDAQSQLGTGVEQHGSGSIGGELLPLRSDHVIASYCKC